MNFYIPKNVEFVAEISSGKVDSFDELQSLLDSKQKLENELATIFYNKVKSDATSKLWSTKEDFLNSLTISFNNVVSLDTSNFVVKMVEFGVGSFDMKPGLLNGSSSKVNKKGQRYAVIPISKFRQGKYNWRDRKSGRFSKGTNIGGDVEFRIVSENSPHSSWIHPGYIGNNFIQNNLNEFDTEINKYIDSKIEVILNRF